VSFNESRSIGVIGRVEVPSELRLGNSVAVSGVSRLGTRVGGKPSNLLDIWITEVGQKNLAEATSVWKTCRPWQCFLVILEPLYDQLWTFYPAPRLEYGSL